MISKHPVQFTGVYILLYMGSLYFKWLGFGILLFTIKLFAELLERLPTDERKTVRSYLIAGLLIYLIVGIVSTWMLNDPEFESIHTAIIIVDIASAALLMLFVYYFKTRLNSLQEFKSVSFFQLMVIPWFLIAYRDELEREVVSEDEQ